MKSRKGKIIMKRKQFVKSMMAVGAAVTLFGTMLGCSKNSENPSQSVENGGSNETNNNVNTNKTYKIGIGQFAQHSSLDNCKEGFLQGLASAGIKEGENLIIYYDNANSDTGLTAPIIEKYIAEEVHLICAIATPMAQTAYGSTMDKDIPVIYTAITDPVEAELAKEDGGSVGNITGTSDKLPVEEQLKMIRQVLPEAKTVGILYTTSEVNSISAIEEYKEKASKYGLEIVESAINTSADVAMAAKDLAGKVDCITNLTDNTVVSALPVVLEAAKKENIPVFGSEIEQVKKGCLASVGIDYVELGKKTGEMAAKILTGETVASQLNFEIIAEGEFYGNTAVAEQLGIELPKDLLDNAAEVFQTIEE